MGTKLKNILFSLWFKGLLVAMIFACSFVFIHQYIALQAAYDFNNAEVFEETSAYRALKLELLYQVALALSDNRILVGFNSDALTEDLQRLQHQYPSFRYRLENRFGTAIGASAALEDLLLEETDSFVAGMAPLWAEKNQWLEGAYSTSGTSSIGEEITLQLPEGWRFYIALSPEDDSGLLGEKFVLYKTSKAQKPFALRLMVASFALAALAYLGLLLGAGRLPRPASDRPHTPPSSHLNGIDRLPLEILILALPIALLLYQDIPLDFDVYPVMLWAVLMPLLCVFLLVTLSLMRRFKAKAILRHLWTYQVLLWFFKTMSPSNLQRVFKPILLVYFLGLGCFNLVIGALVPELGPLGLLIWLLVNGIVAYLCLRDLKTYYLLKAYVHEQVQGQLDARLDNSLVSPLFKDFAQDLSALHQGLELALADALKNERMRTELITNVTHDLKNPLTSIISYVDLLSQEALDNERARGYIDILQDKSLRLKTLIDHLVEASKLSSGVVVPELKSLDLIAFLKQIEGEYADAFEAKGLQWRLQCESPSVLLMADDKMLLRILDNLVGNIVKYALSNTRVYVEVTTDQNPPPHVISASTYPSVSLTFKNISEHALTQGGDELMERFVRADSARSSEGNGLGLSIAQSPAAAMKAHLTIAVDGDMFKASIKF